MLMKILFVSLPAILVGLIVYFSINEKMHAHPWRFMALALIALIVPFWWQVSFDTLIATLDRLRPKEKHFEDIKLSLSLVNNVVSAFVGALFGTATTNRAMYLNSKRLRELKDRKERRKVLFLEAEEIKRKLTNPTITFDHEEFMKMHKLRQTLLYEYIDELYDIMDEEESLLPIHEARNSEIY